MTIGPASGRSSPTTEARSCSSVIGVLSRDSATSARLPRVGSPDGGGAVRSTRVHRAQRSGDAALHARAARPGAQRAGLRGLVVVQGAHSRDPRVGRQLLAGRQDASGQSWRSRTPRRRLREANRLHVHGARAGRQRRRRLRVHLSAPGRRARREGAVVGSGKPRRVGRSALASRDRLARVGLAVRARRLRRAAHSKRIIELVPTFEELLERWGGEQVVIHHDAQSGAWIFICLHSTRLGPAGGGTRMKVYDTPADGLADAMRLSAGMTAKLAVAGLELGGGKAVLAVPNIPAGDERRALLHRYGDLVASLGGNFLTSSDINTAELDMDVISERTKHVFGRSESNGGAGNPGPHTAMGVYHGIRASLAHVFGSSEVNGRTVLVQGAGSVGAPLAVLLGHDGAVVRVADVDAERAEAAATAAGGTTVPAEAALATQCDVY